MLMFLHYVELFIFGYTLICVVYYIYYAQIIEELEREKQNRETIII